MLGCLRVRVSTSVSAFVCWMCAFVGEWGGTATAAAACIHLLSLAAFCFIDQVYRACTRFCMVDVAWPSWHLQACLVQQASLTEHLHTAQRRLSCSSADLLTHPACTCALRRGEGVAVTPCFQIMCLCFLAPGFRDTWGWSLLHNTIHPHIPAYFPAAST